MDLKKLMWLKAATGGEAEKTATGNPVTFTAKIAKALKSLVVPLNYTQSGSGDPAPDNVRSISGISGFTCTHNETDLDITFPDNVGTVYGGSLDIISGVLTITHKGITKTWSEGTNAELYATYERRQFALSPVGKAAGATAIAVCNVAKWKWNFSSEDDHFFVHNGSAYVFLPQTTEGTTSIQLVYELATPTTVQLTAEQVSTIVGANSISANVTGDLSVTYYDKR